MGAKDAPVAAGPMHATDWNVTADALDLNSVDPLVGHGQACLEGTRIPVSVVLGCLSDGMAVEQIVEQYPSLSVTFIRAAAADAAHLAGGGAPPARR